MNETIQMSLDAKLIRSLKQATAQQGITVDQTIGNLVAEYLDSLRRKQLTIEMEQYRAQHAELLAQYRGQYVGIHDGRVLDHDTDGGTLYARLSQEYDDMPILIVAVGESPEQEISILTPHVEINE